MSIKFYDYESGAELFDGPGEWIFSWILEGRAMQDVLHYADPRRPDEDARAARRTGTTLRWHDHEGRVWRGFWLGATSGIFVPLMARPVAEGIMLEGPDPDGTLNRWMFSDIDEDSFHWRGWESKDGGATWRLVQEMRGQRQRSQTAPLGL